MADSPAELGRIQLKKVAAAPPKCVACAGPLADGICTRCGFMGQESDTPDGVGWPVPGSIIDAQVPITMVLSLPASPGARRFLARDEAGGRHEVFVAQGSDPQGALEARRAALETLPPGLCLSPDRTVTVGELRYTLTKLPEGADRLTEVLNGLLDADDVDALETVRRFGAPVARLFADAHDRNLFFAEIDPDEVMVAEGWCRFLDPPRPHSIDGGPVPAGRQRAARGYSAPEVHGFGVGSMDARADVFFVGMVLYYLLSRVGALEEAADVMDRLPSPGVYRDGLPPGIVAVVQRATSPVAGRRYTDCRALRTALEIAIASDGARRAVQRRRLSLQIGHELHIGILKGQYAPMNQDDLFVAYDARNGVGLFLVSDGVSISAHGTGDQASRCVREEALRTWHQLPRFDAGEGPPLPRLPEPGEPRRALIRAMLDGANHRIANWIHEDRPRFEGPPEGIMAATAVVALVDGNQLTLSSIGDSRIYLIRDGHMTSLLTYHDLGTQLIRMRRATPRVARSAPAAAALVRCVGEFEKDEEDRLVPVPLQPEFRELAVLPGDIIVLCSDGIPDYAGFDEEHAEARICQMVESAPGAPWAAFELMVLANRGGGGDNISCIVLAFDDLAEDPS